MFQERKDVSLTTSSTADTSFENLSLFRYRQSRNLVTTCHEGFKESPDFGLFPRQGFGALVGLRVSGESERTGVTNGSNPIDVSGNLELSLANGEKWSVS